MTEWNPIQSNDLQGPYRPTTATSMKRSMKNRLRILSNHFAIFRSRPVTKGIQIGTEERGQRPSSDRDGRIYRLAVLVLKKKIKIWSFHVVVVQRWQRIAHKSVARMYRILCYCNYLLTFFLKITSFLSLKTLRS